MKNFKRILSIVLAMTMVLAMGMTAFATGANDPGTGDPATPAAPTTVSMTFTGGKAGHTYTAYQILKGTATAKTATSAGTLEDIQWGADAPANYKSQYNTAAAAAKAIAEQNDARAFAQSLNLTGNGSKQVTLTADGNVVFSDLEPGYYVVIDTNNNTDAVEGDYSSAIVVEVAGDINGKLKGDAPSSDKKVGDTCDTEKVQIDLSDLSYTDPAWQDSADYDFGDMVPFRLHATTASNVSSYRKYHITFQDKQSAGLGMPTSWTVAIPALFGDEEFTITNETAVVKTTTKGTKVTVQKVAPDTGNTFAIKVTFEQNEPTLKEGEIISYLNAECDSKDIYVKYESELKKDTANIGKTGNPNESYIKYSNNPEDKDDEDEGKTPEDKVIVFTYKMVVDKVDEKGEDLKGANFTLYKQVTKDEEGAKTGAAIKTELFGDNAKLKTAAAALADDKYYVVAGEKTINNEVQFDFEGIDDGTYVLVETVVPEGYNPWNAVQVVVSAEHDETSDDPQLTELTCTAPFTTDNLESATISRQKEGTTHTTESGEAYAEIINNSGAELPSTGGMGTTIFYIVGAMLAIGAAVVLVTKKRMNG